MSFKIFTMQLTGKIKPVEAIEKKRKELRDDYDEFVKVGSSEELSKYLELERRVQSGEFIKKKAEMDKLKFKGSKEFNQLKEFEKLKKSSAIRKYFRVAGSTDLKKYEALKGSEKLDEYEKLSKTISGIHSEKENKTRLKSLKADSDIKFYFKFKKSSLFKNYQDIDVSNELKRYYELEKIISSDTFRERKAFLEDKNKWEKTEECALQKEYDKMKKLPHLIKYFKYKDSSSFRFFEEWETAFEDSFSASNLDVEKWSCTSYLADKMLGDNYAPEGDLQVYTCGENVRANGKLSIEVKKERKTGKVWQPSTGFVPAELEYTSGIVSTWNKFWMEDGIFEAKIKFDPSKQVVSSMYLSGENNVPRVNLIEMGMKNRVGVSSLNSQGKVEVHGEDISNLKKGKWYIFSVEKTGNKTTWKINDAEIFASDNHVPRSKLHLNASSIVVDEIPGSLLPASFETEWVRCYRKK